MSDSALLRKKDKKNSESEFEKYLKSRGSVATYNGVKLKSEGWHKEIFGKQPE